MKRFAFRLERLRQLRERAERAQAAELGAAMREEQARLEALAEAEAHLERVHGQGVAGAGEMFTPADLHRRALLRDAAAEQTVSAGESARDANEKVADEQARWSEKHRDLRSVEKLKEKQFDTWRNDGARADQKEMDGVALNRHGQGEKQS